MLKRILLFLTAILMAHSALGSYHVLVATKQHQLTDAEDSFFTHFRSRRSLTDPDEILKNLIEADGLGSGEEEDNMVTSREQTFQFYVKNADTENSASMRLGELMPSNAILTEFIIDNQAHTYRYNDINVKNQEQAKREYEESVKAGMSAIMVGNVQSTNHRCSDCRSEDIDGQTVTAVINVAAGDVLSISLSYVVPILIRSMEFEKDLYRTDVTITLEESAKKMTSVIMSPNYPESYPNNADLTYLIKAPIGDMSFSASLLSFDSEACCDHLYVFDGATDTAPVLAVVSGDTFSTDPIISSGPSILLKFQTDFVVNSGGFAMQFSPVENEIPSKLIANKTYVVNQNQGVVKSPGYPKSYPPSSVLTWNITSDPGTKLRLVIYDIDVLPQETLQIFDSVSNSLLINSTESELMTYQTITASENGVSVVFTSIQKIVFRRGFYLEFSSDLPCSSSIHLNSDDHDWNILTSPNYPNNYENNANCLWVISAPGVNVVRIEITMLNLESYFDTLQIFDGNGTEDTSLLGTLSGVGGNSIEYVSLSNSLTILFNSDETVTDSGFQIKYKLYHIWEACSSTPHAIDWTSGFLKNPDWPGSTYYYNDCQWLISVTPGKIVEVQLENYYGCYSDLIFYDGDSISDGVLWWTSNRCSYDIYDAIQFRSSTDQLLIVMKDDYYYNYYYAEYRFTFQESDDEVLICEDQEPLTTSPGMITSPFYPRYYPSDISCQWLLQANENNYVTLKIENIRLYSYDLVSFYKGDTATSLIAQCGYYYDGDCYDGMVITSTSNTLLITASTSSSNGFFKFVYSFVSDSQIIEKDDYSGYAYSPNYPVSYPNSYNHVYYISVASDYIQFYFEHFETESCCDYLQMYDGSSTSSREIATLRGRHDGYSGQTSGTFLTMRFYTDGSVADEGFKMAYCSPGHCNSIDQGKFSVSSSAAHSYIYAEVHENLFFSSPGAGAYPNNEDFYWYIECNAGRYIAYYFYRLDIDSSDFVKLYQNLGTDPDLLVQTYSGVNNFYSSNSVSISGATSTVWFHSDSEFSGQGFYVKYICYD